MPNPYWHLSIDHLRDTGILPMQRFRTKELDWSSHRAQIFAAFHSTIAAVATAGNHVILEHILETPGWLDELKQLFSPFDTVFVGVMCPLETLEQRELARGDRPIGSAKQDFHNIHNGLRYDLEVDGTDEVSTNVRLIQSYARKSARASSFVTLS